MASYGILLHYVLWHHMAFCCIVYFTKNCTCYLCFYRDIKEDRGLNRGKGEKRGGRERVRGRVKKGGSERKIKERSEERSEGNREGRREGGRVDKKE